MQVPQTQRLFMAKCFSGVQRRRAALARRWQRSLALPGQENRSK